MTAGLLQRFGRRLRLGMVGGGLGSMIGETHRMAARLDNRYELVAGCFSADAARGRAAAAALLVPAERSYADFAAMAAAEAGRADGIEVVTICTPPDSHYAIAREFLRRGIDAICDKPMTATPAEAVDLVGEVRRSGRDFCLTHNYTGYPMARQARGMIAAGELGAIRVVQVEYVQDWLATRLEETGHKQAGWRVDPAKAGPGGCLGDIGTHAQNIAAFVSGLALQEVAADLCRFVPGRKLDDNVHLLLRYEGGARGMLWASQVSPGNENGLRLRIYGEKAGLEWSQEHPNQLRFTPLGKPPQVQSRGGAAVGAAAGYATRIPAGHPEGYLEAFANLYRDLAEQIEAKRAGRAPDQQALLVPTVEDGAHGVKFIEAAVESGARNGAWVDARLQV